MTESEKKKYYHQKALDSFKTKFELFVFNLVKDGKKGPTLEDFQNFEILDSLILLYTAEYWQYEKDHLIEGRLSNEEIYQGMIKIKSDHLDLIEKMKLDYVERKFPKVFSYADFCKIQGQVKCGYCHITKDKIKILADQRKLFKKNLRGWNLEMDRKRPNEEYKRDNCVMACYWCNNAKTDEFSYDEFQGIGQAIKKVWEKRLK